MAGNLRDAMGIDKLVAFFAREPTVYGSTVISVFIHRLLTLAELKASRVPDHTRAP